MDGVDVIFKLTTSPSLMSLLRPSKYQVLRTVKNPSHEFGWNRRDLETDNFT